MNKVLYQGDYMRKPKLSIDEQINHMKNDKGIQFNIVSEDEAKKFLTNNSYYFKIKSYAKNYDKYTEGEKAGKYINLEFAYLQELSTLDMYFRRFILRMTLDIEHFLKVQLIRDAGENIDVDGYSIVEDLFTRHSFIKENIERNGKNSATADLISKCDGEFAIWNIVEILSFGDVMKLYELYYQEYPTENSMEKYLWSIKFLRNAAAHNNCLLNSLKTPYGIKIKPNKEINTFISKIPGIKPNSRIKKMKNPVIHDFIVTLYMFHNIISSEGIKKHTMTELKELVDDRMTRNKHYFEKNQIITSHYEFAKIIIDYFYDLCV